MDWVKHSETDRILGGGRTEWEKPSAETEEVGDKPVLLRKDNSEWQKAERKDKKYGLI